MIVIYAEKPGMARLFAAALGGIELEDKTISFKELSKNEKLVENIQRNNGFLKTTFEGKPYIITWGYGHLCELKDIRDYNPALTKWKNIPLPYIPKAYEYKVKENSRNQFDKVSRIFNRDDVEYIVNATDDDREGEAIFYYTYTLTGSKKQTLRAILNKQTQPEIIRAFSNLEERRSNIESAARARGIADWQIGISLTIKATLQYGKFGDTYNIGRVMTPTLNLIVEREKQIASFKSNVSYSVKAKFTTADGETFNGEYEEKFPTKEAAEAFAAKLNKENCTVKGIENKKITENPPFPYSLDTLQKAANDTFSMTASDTLAAAQKVYEGYGSGGSLSYPRTDSSFYTEDMKKELPKYIETLRQIPLFKKYLQDIPLNPVIPDKYFDDDKVDSHAALSVTEILPPFDRLSAAEKNVYELVARSLIMLVYPDYRYIRTKISIDADGHEFTARGRNIEEPGWTVIRKKKKKSNQVKKDSSPEASENNALPELKKNDKLTVSFDISKTKTQKPSRYTDSTLLTAMKNCGRNVDDADYAKILSSIDGIGRPSTRAATIEKLVRTQYVVRQKNHLIPTQKAMLLMDRLPVEELKSPELTARWESELDQIARGNADAESFINEVQEKSREWCHLFYGEKIELKKNDSGIVEIATSAKKSAKFPAEAFGHKFTDSEKENLQNGDTYYFSKLITKKGTVFSAWVQYTDNELKYFKYNPFLEEAAYCPKCHRKMIPRENDIYCASGCVHIPSEISGKRLGIQEQYDLLTRGYTEFINGFISRKTGKNFSARLKIDENFRITYSFDKKISSDSVVQFYTQPSLLGKHYHEVWNE